MMNRVIRRSSAIAAVATGLAAFAQPCEWSPLGRGVDPAFTGARVLTLEVFDDGAGDALYVGGNFDAAELVSVHNVARWDGRTWSALGDGLRSGHVHDLAIFDDGRGGGPALYAGGSFETSGGRAVQCVARWDGASWLQVGEGLWPTPSSKAMVHALCVHDDGSGAALYVGGWFSSVDETPETYCIARWDGESWSSVGGGVGSRVRALAVFDDGSGPTLYAGGYLQSAGGTPARYIAKWEGESWWPLGAGTDRYINDLAVFDDGTGPALYVGGPFGMAGGAPAAHLARWDGSAWSEVGGGLDQVVSAFGVFDDGRGPALYVGGGFVKAGGVPAQAIARWDGASWEAVGGALAIGGTLPSVSAIARFDHDESPTLYVGGTFLRAGAEPANHIARWRCESPACPADCDGSGGLEFADFLCFQNLFAAADPLADCDGSGGLDFFDFLCFQNEFAAGCP